jgi:hypothetical protein
MYSKRQEMKQQGSTMEKVAKLLMNSLYGKFGQKFTDRDNWIPLPETLEELDKYDDFERFGNYIRVKTNMTKPASFCFPIWALYVTAYGRLKLYDILRVANPYYCDTDSIITKSEFQDSDQLGKLKREMIIDYGVIVKPKFYGFMANNKQYVKIKGLGVQLKYGEFEQFIQNPKKTYTKFMKFKESVRRGFTPNELQDITKNMSLEDDKRDWGQPFSFRELQESKPLKISSDYYQICQTNSVQQKR